MKYLLDTNICIYIIKRKPLQVWQRFQRMSPKDVGISVITVAELNYGVYKSQRQTENKLALDKFLLPLQIIPFDEKSTVIYGQIRAALEKQGRIIGGMDLLIAAQAISLNVTLVTNNVDEFARIPELLMENWLR